MEFIRNLLTTPKETEQKQCINTQIFKNKQGNTYKWFVSNKNRKTLTVMDPKEFSFIFPSSSVLKHITAEVKKLFARDKNAPMEFIGICQGRFVGINPSLLGALKDVNNTLQQKMGNDCKITQIVFTKNLGYHDWVIASSTASQEKLKKITKLDLIPSNVYKDKYGEIDNYISGYNIKLDMENFAKKYGFESLVDKEIVVTTVEEEIPVVTVTRDDIIRTELDDHDPLTPNTAEV
tara:strand:- start:772 stop:1476 length:705 start_codon:yes stop_codon:yes gene_type:complete